MDKLANPNNGKLAMRRNTAGSLLSYLQGLELIYHAEMSETELAVYLESLSRFPVCEVKAAADRLMLNPPGSWTGMPKLPDIIREIHIIREDEAERIQQQGGKSLADPHCPKCYGSS